MRLFTHFLKRFFFVVYFCGCGDAPLSNSLDNNLSENREAFVDVVEILSQSHNQSDFAELLISKEVKTNPISNNLEQLADFYRGKTSVESIDGEVDINDSARDDNVSYISSISVKNNLHIDTINSFNQVENVNAAKDATIASLKELNRELLIEIKQLREFQFVNTQNYITDRNSDDLSHDSAKIDDGLINRLNIQQTQIDELVSENKSLQRKVLELTQNPYSRVTLTNPVRPTAQTFDEELSSTTFTPQKPASLHFDAVVTSINGKNKEAFYTEFFILSKDLESLLLKSEIKLSDYPKIDSYSELWARSRKNPFLYPGVQKKIRTILLDQVNAGEGQRIRTDIDGAGIISQIKVGSFYMIGSAALGKIGVTWNTPFNVTSGLNKLSLTLANSSWSL